MGFLFFVPGRVCRQRYSNWSGQAPEPERLRRNLRFPGMSPNAKVCRTVQTAVFLFG